MSLGGSPANALNPVPPAKETDIHLDRDVQYICDDDKHFPEIGRECCEHSNQIVVAMTLLTCLPNPCSMIDAAVHTQHKHGQKATIGEYVDATEIIILDFKHKGWASAKSQFLFQPLARLPDHGRIKLFGTPRQWKHFRPLFQAVFLSGGGGYYPPRLSQTPRLPVLRQK